MNRRPVIALLWHRAEDETKARRARLDGVFRALTALGATPEPVVYANEVVEAAREQLLRIIPIDVLEKFRRSLPVISSPARRSIGRNTLSPSASPR